MWKNILTSVDQINFVPTRLCCVWKLRRSNCSMNHHFSIRQRQVKLLQGLHRVCEQRPGYFWYLVLIIQSESSVTFSGLDLINGHFSAIQDDVFSLPALASLSIPDRKQSNYIRVMHRPLNHVSNQRPVGQMWPAVVFYVARERFNDEIFISCFIFLLTSFHLRSVC